MKILPKHMLLPALGILGLHSQEKHEFSHFTWGQLDAFGVQ